MRHKVVALCGKGGVGKTTVSAVIARALSLRKDLRALIVDADPAGGLGMALSVPVKRSVDEVRTDIIRTIKKGESDKRDLAVSVDYLLMEAVTERGNLAFLSIGRPEQIGCYCSVNTLLKNAIELLAGNFDITVIDAEAGIEQVNRNVMSAVDFLVLVSDTSVKGIRVAETIKKVAGEISGQDKTGLLLNRVRSEDEVGEISARTELDIIGWLPEDETIRRFDARELSFFNLPPCPAYNAAVKALEKAGILK